MKGDVRTSINNLEAGHTIVLRKVLSNILSTSHTIESYVGIIDGLLRATRPPLPAMKPRSSYSKNRTVYFIKDAKTGIPSQLQHYPLEPLIPCPIPRPIPSQQYSSMTLMKPFINIPRELQTSPGTGLNPDSLVELSYLTVGKMTQMYVYFSAYHTKAH